MLHCSLDPGVLKLTPTGGMKMVALSASSVNNLVTLQDFVKMPKNLAHVETELPCYQGPGGGVNS